MLVLTRKSGERITIGPDIVVTVLEAHGQRVRLGIEAPKSVHIMRPEIADKMAERRGMEKVIAAPDPCRSDVWEFVTIEV